MRIEYAEINKALLRPQSIILKTILSFFLSSIFRNMNSKDTHDWDINYFHYMTPFIDKQINVLQVGCTHHFNIDFFKSYILTHKDSHMYSINLCDTNSNSNSNQPLPSSTGNIHLYNHASYDILIEFSKQKIEFDIIIFYDDMSDDLFSQLILTFNLLKSNGILFIYQSENFNKNIDEFHKTIQLFTELKDTQIEILKQSQQYIFIRKQSISKIDKMESAKIKEALKNVLSTKLTQESFTLPQPTLKITDLQFELQTSDKPVKNMTKYGFIKEYDEYEDYLIHDKDNIDRLDPNFIISNSFENKDTFNTLKKIFTDLHISFDENTQNILNIFFEKNEHRNNYIFTFLKNYLLHQHSLKNKSIRILYLARHTKKISTIHNLIELIQKYPSFKKINFFFPLLKKSFTKKNINLSNIKIIPITNKYSTPNHNVLHDFLNYMSYPFSFFNILEITKYLKLQKIDYIHIALTKYLKYNLLFKNYPTYISNILIHILFLILSIQNKNGSFSMTVPIISTLPFIQFLYIISFFYKKVEIKKSPRRVKNIIQIDIMAHQFKDIQNNHFIRPLYSICTNLELLSKSNKPIFIHSFIKNNIPSSFIHYIHTLLHNDYKNIIQNTKDKIIISKYIHKKEIIRKIINTQIHKALQFNILFNQTINNIVTKLY